LWSSKFLEQELTTRLFTVAYQYVYADSLQTVWYVTTSIAGAGLLVSLFVKNESMDRGNNAKQRFKVEEKAKMKQESRDAV
jgi:hypothetical protein